MNNSIPSVYNKVAGSISAAPVVQKTSAPVVSEKKDSFEKSNGKILATTSAATVGGGVAGLMYAKMTKATKSTPRDILDKYNLDFGALGSARDKIEEQVYKNEFEPLLKSMVDKLSSNKELTSEELKLAEDLNLDPNMVRFFDSAKERLGILKDKLNKHPNDRQGVIGGYSVMSHQYDKFTLNSCLDFSKWLSSIEENGLKHLDNEEFLYYASSRYFKDINFKIKYDKNGVANGIVSSIDFKNALPEGERLSDTTYTFRELVEKVIVKKEFKHSPSINNVELSFLASEIGLKLSENEKQCCSDYMLRKRFFEFCDIAVDKAKTTNEELKNAAIKAYKNKQMLKFAGIGALVAGVLTACGALIHKKVKEKE